MEDCVHLEEMRRRAVAAKSRDDREAAEYQAKEPMPTSDAECVVRIARSVSRGPGPERPDRAGPAGPIRHAPDRARGADF